ncbi:MAG: phosphatidate cytidylyltransferase [Gammaproteobacteria bacterium]|nr:phosphatidate cytidylyltransferase [Gammaproteobacteria bacterium]
MNRLIPGVLMAAVCLLLLVFGSSLLIHLAVFAVGCVAQSELLRMTCPKLKGSFYFLTYIAVLLPLVGAYTGSVDGVMAGAFLSFMGIAFISFRLAREVETIFNYFASACFATFYVSIFLSYLVLVVHLDGGNYWLIILLAITAGADTGAYYFGKKYGRKKLLPIVSPKKTVVGSFSGLVTGTAAGLCISFFLPVTISFIPFICAASILVIIGMTGDLAESIIKRSCKVKDSGTILGGHGGVLDRIDSMLPSAPCLFFLLSWGIL